MVRAKFFVTKVDGGTVWLSPVTGGSEENKSFYKWTPSGQIILSTINDEAVKQFVVGQEMYVDFTDATTPIPE